MFWHDLVITTKPYQCSNSSPEATLKSGNSG